MVGKGGVEHIRPIFIFHLFSCIFSSISVTLAKLLYWFILPIGPLILNLFLLYKFPGKVKTISCSVSADGVSN